MLDHGTLETGSVDETLANRHRMRHSAAHVMADAVLKLFPEAKMGIGPPTQDGFYYDFDVTRPFTPGRPGTHRGPDERKRLGRLPLRPGGIG